MDHLPDILCWAGVVLGVPLIAWALFWDRARGRRRCPKCWYDLRGTPEDSLTCSECGHTVRKKQHQYRTRRRRFLAMLGLLMIAGVVVAREIRSRADEEGWLPILPVTGLIVALPWVEEEDLAKEIQERITWRSYSKWRDSGSDQDTRPRTMSNREALWDWQWRLLASEATRTLGSDFSSLESKRVAISMLMRAVEHEDLFRASGRFGDRMVRALSEMSQRYSGDPDHQVALTLAVHLVLGRIEYLEVSPEVMQGEIVPLLEHPELSCRTDGLLLARTIPGATEVLEPSIRQIADADEDGYLRKEAGKLFETIEDGR